MLLTTKYLSGERLLVALYHAATMHDEDHQPLAKADALKIVRQEGYVESLIQKHNLNLQSNEKGTKWTCSNPDYPEIETMEGSSKNEAFMRCLIASKIGPMVDYPFKSSYGIDFVASNEDIVEEEIPDIPESDDGVEAA